MLMPTTKQIHHVQPGKAQTYEASQAHTQAGQTSAVKPASNVITYLEWQAPGRPFEKRGKQYFSTVILIALLVEVCLGFFFIIFWPLMLLVASLVFLVFVLAKVPPTDFHYKLSSEGVRVEDHFYLWQELYDFYFKRRSGIDVVHVRTKAFFPGELTLSIAPNSKEQVKTILIRFLPYREYVKPTFTEKAGNWLASSFPLDNSKPQEATNPTKQAKPHSAHAK